MLDYDTLIIVCCHGIYQKPPRRLKSCTPDSIEESNWLIEPFQACETPTFVEHVRAGVTKLANRYPRAILCFSGGATKPELTDITEAEGYTDVALENDLFGFCKDDLPKRSGMRTRMCEENFATDSYQNLLLSLIQFPIFQLEAYAAGKVAEEMAPNMEISEGWEVGTGYQVDLLRKWRESAGKGKLELKLPRKLVIISHDFKRERFMRLHIQALKSLWPGESFHDMDVEYVGIDPPMDESKKKAVIEGEQKKGYGPWESDLHGSGTFLRGKRRKRGWDEEAFVNWIKPYFDQHALREIRTLLTGRELS